MANHYITSDDMKIVSAGPDASTVVPVNAAITPNSPYLYIDSAPIGPLEAPFAEYPQMPSYNGTIPPKPTAGPPRPVRVTRPSTAQLENDRKTQLGSVEMGLIPSNRAQLKQYGLKDGVTKALATWYFYQWLLTDYERYPAFSRKRERLEEEENALLIEICGFLSDYLLMSCLGEARHGKLRHFSPSFKHVTCPLCVTALGADYYKQERTAGATFLWGRFTNRKDAFASLMHIFCDHPWPNGSLGGAQWGYVSLITKRLNEAFYSNDRIGMIVALDEVVYLQHCSGSVWNSRFSWSMDFFTGYINQVLNKKSTGKECCWELLKEAKLINSPLIEGSDGCKCPPKEVEQGSNSQTKFIEENRQLDTCEKCDANINESGQCSNNCSNCLTCFPKGTHYHKCPNGECRRPIGEPFTLPEKCPNWCEDCGGCYNANYTAHKKCHYCKIAWDDWTLVAKTHPLCQVCGDYGLCSKLEGEKGFPICVLCLKNPQTLDPSTILKPENVQMGRFLQLKETRPIKLQSCWVSIEPWPSRCGKRAVGLIGSVSYRRFYCLEHILPNMSDWKWSRYKRIKYTRKEEKEWANMNSQSTPTTPPSS